MLLSRLPTIASALLILFIGAATFIQLRDVFIQTTDKEQASTKVAANQPVVQKPVQQFNIASFNLFGKELKNQPKTEAIPEKLPETKLKLKLTGVHAGQLDEENGALIEGPDRSTSYYKVGDQLPGNAILNRVFPDRIIIERSGKLENLYFAEKFSSASSITAVQPKNASDNQVKPAPVAKRKVNAVDDARKQSIKDRLSKLRQRISNKNN